MEINSLIRSVLPRFLTLFTAIVSVTGFLIVNNYYTKYNITDYTIFSAKIIFTGVTAILITMIAILYYFVFLDAYDYHKGFLSNFYNFGVRPIHFTNIFLTSFVFNSKYCDGFFKDITINDYIFNGALIHIMMMFATMAFYFRFYMFIKEKSVSKKWAIARIIFIWVLYGVSITAAILMFSNNEDYKKCLYFFYYLSFFSAAYYWRSAPYKKAEENSGGVERGSLLNKLFPQIRNTKYYGNLYFYSTVCLYVAIFFVITSLYSANIYPLLDESQGGAISKRAMITTKKGELVEGSIIHRDGERYYLTVKDNKIIIVELSEINYIESM